MTTSAAGVRALIVLGMAAGPVAGGPERTFNLYNDVTDRRLATYTIERTVRRVGEREHEKETLTFTQPSRWVRLNLLAESRGNSKLVQMLVEESPRKITLLRGGKPVEKPPEPSELHLWPGSTRLATVDWSKADCPCIVPATAPTQQGAMFALLDVAHWPAEKKKVGDRWDSAIESEFFSGTQSLELKEVVKQGDRTCLRIELNVNGRFRGRAAKDGAEFVGGKALFIWPYGRNILETLDGSVVWQDGGRDGGQYEMKVLVGAATNEVISIDAANELIDQLNAINGAIVDKNGGKIAEARAACAKYVEKWPQGLWRPAIDYLTTELNPERNAKIAEAEFRQRVVAGLKRWQEAAEKDDDAELNAARDELRKLADGERDRLVSQLKHASENVRASTAFALAFGTSGENLAMLCAAARDPSARVRGWALYGLAERGSRDTDVSVLEAGLNDEDAVVRARACEAVAECVPAKSPRIAELRERIFTLMQKDNRDGTRIAAAAAMGRIGTAEDVARLKKSIRHETSPKVRKRIERSIGQISAGQSAESGG